MERDHYYLYISHKEGIHSQDSANDLTIELPSELQLKGNWFCGLTEIDFKCKEANKHVFLCTYICQDSLIKRGRMPVLRCIFLKDKYPNFEVGLKCIIMVF